MSQVATNDIFQAIKNDDLVLFSSLIQGKENFSFGRFPLLSLCYLYKAKKIVKKYKDVLLEVQKTENYYIVAEKFEIYKKFKEKAGRCLRLYVDNDLVSPIEMLAILHQDTKVKKEFKNYQFYQQNEKILQKLEQIYKINSQSLKLNDEKIAISRRKMSKYQKKIFKRSFAFSLASIVFLFSFFCVFNFAIGWGTENNPFKIYSQSQFFSAFEKDGNYILQSDMIIDKNFSISKFSGNIDGNGHTIFVDFVQKENLIQVNDGKLKNFKMVFKQEQFENFISLSFFVGENNGLIDNVVIECANLSLNLNNSDEDSCFGVFSNINNGTISNCSLKMNGQISASLNSDVAVSGFVGVNNGNVQNCKFEEGNLSANEVDLAGIVCKNTEIGNVLGCKNYEILSQTSEIDGWSPNVAGIVLLNYGSIKNSINYGNLSVVSNNSQEEASGKVFVGGIVSQNFGALEKCLNKSDLKAHSQNLIVYCGGVTAYSYSSTEEENSFTSQIENCGENGKIDAKSENGKVFCGGFSGFLYGSISNCFSLCNFTNDFEQDKNCAGTFIGSCYLQLETLNSGELFFVASNNYVLMKGNASYQVGAMIIANETDFFGYKKGDNYGASNIYSFYVSNISSSDLMEQLEIYWND